MNNITEELCSGSGKRPVETVILDTVMGVNPKGTCQKCNKSFTMNWYKIPDHFLSGEK